MTLPTLTVVTPWLNHRELERDYWQAMNAAAATVLIIDNGSEPPLPNAWRIDDNRGFSHACNVGLNLATTDAVLFLNNDIRATRRDWLDNLAAALEPGVLVGANLRFDPHGAVEDTPLPYLDGWCLAGMTDDLLNIGGFDESYEEPAYYSDNDLCFRARLEGMTLREADVGLVHLTNRTAGPADERIRAVTDRNRAKFHTLVRKELAFA